MKKLLFRTFIFSSIVILLLPLRTFAQTFDVPAGDVDALIAAMNAANANGPGADIINLETGTYTLSAVDNRYVYIDEQITQWGGGPNGLPPIIGDLTINGHDAVIARAADAPDFRFFIIAGHSSLTLNAVTLRNGQLLDQDLTGMEDFGGAIYNVGQLTTHDSTFSGNKSVSGGAIKSVTSTSGGGVALYYSTLKDNYARSDGGALNVNGYALLLIESSTITNNRAGDEDGDEFYNGLGGGMELGNVETVIHGTTISGNRTASTGLGGGMYVIGGYQATVTIKDSTISGNSAGQGGGIYDGATNYQFTNVTVAGNQGTGIRSDNGKFTFSNVLVAANGDNNCRVTTFDPKLGMESKGHNFDTDGSCLLRAATDINNFEPKIGELADNGGPTFTHELLLDSPATNRGDVATCSPVDQRGTPRVGVCDIGAVEYSAYVAPQLVQLGPLDGTVFSPTHITFNWSAFPDSASYDIQYGNANDFSDATTVSVLTPSYVSPKLPFGTYYWRARSVHYNGAPAQWNSVWSFSVQSPPNAAPEINIYDATTPLLKWTPVSWAMGYGIEIADNPNFTNPYWSRDDLDRNTLEVQPDQPLAAGLWYWRVKALRADGTWSAWSTAQTFYVNEASS